MMDRPYLVAGALALTCWAFPLRGLAEEAADTFNLLYSNDLKRVAATKDTADDLALAAQLLEAAKTPKTQAEMIGLLCDKVYELGMKDPKGFRVAVQAMELAAEKAPARKDDWLGKIIAIRQRQYEVAKGEVRTQAAAALVEALEKTAAAKADAGDLDGAAALYRRAMAVAGTAGGEAKNRIKDKLDQAAAHQRIQKQIEQLKTKVEANPADAVSRKELVRLYVVELDSPADAAKFLGEGADEQMRKYVLAAARPVSEAPELACLELGDWYIGLSDKAAGDAKAAMLARAAAYYRRFLGLHTAEDASRTKATLALTKVEAAAAQSGKSTAAKDAAGAGWVDVLRLVDLTKDVKFGKWEPLSDGLHVAPEPGSNIAVIPVKPEGAYELRVKFTRNLGRKVIALGLPVGPTQVVLFLETDQVSLRDVAGNPPPGRLGTGELGRPYILEVSVVPHQTDTKIEVKLNGRGCLAWRGPYTDLSMHWAWKRFDRKALGVGADFSDVTFHSVELRMTSGKSVPLRDAKPATPAKP